MNMNEVSDMIDDCELRDAEWCIRCGTDLVSDEDFQTGVCCDCWDSDKDGDLDDEGDY